VKPIGILPKQETVSGSGISWDICKSAPRSRQIATPAPHHSVFTGRMPFLPRNQQRQNTEGKAQNENDHYNGCFDPSAGSQTGPVVQEKQIPFVTKRPGSQPITWIPDEPQLRQYLDWFGHFCSTHYVTNTNLGTSVTIGPYYHAFHAIQPRNNWTENCQCHQRGATPSNTYITVSDISAVD